MKSGGKAGDTPEKQRTRLKDELKKLLGKKTEVTDGMANRFLDKGAINEVASKMTSCVKAAGSDANKKKACRMSSSLKEDLAKALGKKSEDITQIDILKKIRDGATKKVAAALEAAQSGSKTKDEKDAATLQAVKEATGKPDLRKDEVEKYIREGIKDLAGERMQSCNEIAFKLGDKAAQLKKFQECDKNVQDLLKGSFGDDVKEADLESLVEETKEDAVEDAIRETMASETQASTSFEDKKKRIQEIAEKVLGKKGLKSSSIQGWIKRGAVRNCKTTMMICREQLSEQALTLNRTALRDARKKCIDETKSALADSLGKDLSSISPIDVHQFVRDGAKDAVSEAMEAIVNSGSKLTPGKIRDIGKEALANALGKNVSDFKLRDFEMWKRKGAIGKAKKRMRNCIKAVKAKYLGNTTAVAILKRKAIRRCRVKNLRNVIKKSMGNVTMPVSRCKQMLKEGAHHAVREANEACMEAAEGNAAATRLCKVDLSELKEVLSDSLGKDISKVGDADVREFLMDGAEDKVVDVYESCRDGEVSKTDCEKKLKTTLAASLGLDVADASTGRRLQEDDDSVLTARGVKEYIENGAVKNVGKAMDACFTAAEADGAPATKLCTSMTAKEAYCEATNQDPKDVTDEKIHRVMDEAAAYTFATVNEAQADVEEDVKEAKEDGETVELETDTEKKKERDNAVKKCGFDPTQKRLKAIRMKKRAAEKKSAKVLKACTRTKTFTRQQCKIRVRDSWEKATGEKASATESDSEKGTREAEQDRKAVLEVVKENLLGGEAVKESKDTGKSRFRRTAASKAELEMDSQTRKIFGQTRPEKEADGEVEEIKQQIIGERIESFMGVVDTMKPVITITEKRKKCREKYATALTESLGTSVPDKEEAITEAFDRLELDIEDEEADCDSTDASQCEKETQERREKIGTSAKGRKGIRKNDNAKRKAARKMKICEEAGNSETDCEKEAEAEFKKRKGTAWKKLKGRVKQIKNQLVDGTRIKIIRKPRIDICMKVKTTCEAAKDAIASMKADIETSVAEKAKCENVGVFEGFAEDDTTAGVCDICWQAHLKDKKARTSDEMDKASDEVQKDLDKKAKARGRRLSETTDVSAAGGIDIGSDDLDYSSTPPPSAVAYIVVGVIAGVLFTVGGIWYLHGGDNKSRRGSLAHLDGNAQQNRGPSTSVEMSVANPMASKF
jgi:hypothetical protein